ncbi:MAG: polymer-forming cytoskeletal protein [Bacteroidota bacterium]|jgi:cytoskeletal protein CcmA (bactofilin family)
MATKKDPHTEDVSIISNGVTIDGNLKSEGNVRVDGIINGNITVSGNLTLGDSSRIAGEVKARCITMSGQIEGKVFVEEKLRLESKSVFKGDLIAKTLIIEEGALFDGRSSMKQNSSSSKDLNG